MNGPHFDAWTRRRFGLGLAASGALAALVGLLEADAGGNKKKRKRKRCRKLLQACTPGGKRKCCGKLRCDFHSNNLGIQTFCCKTEGKSCEDTSECCVPLSCDPGTKQCLEEIPSDRAIKATFGSVDPGDMLERVRSLPISTWNYSSDDAAIRHIGPMAQDFSATFGVGSDDRYIHPIDAQGVSLAAIQGLAELCAELRQENARLSVRVSMLEQTRG